MPTVILLDVSLSMSRPVKMENSAGSEDYNRRNLAIHGINTFLDALSVKNKLEYVSLVIFSSLYEQLVPFTRDYILIKSTLTKLTDFDKTSLAIGLSGAASTITDEWGYSTPSQIILITDGSTGVGQGSLKQILETHKQMGIGDKDASFQFPCTIHVLCLASPQDPTIQASVSMYKKIIDIYGHGGEVCIPESTLSLDSTQKMFCQFFEEHCSPFHGVLECGHLECNIHIFPKPQVYSKSHDFEDVELEVCHNIKIVGFLDTSDVASPPFISRHLVFPLPPQTANTDAGASDEAIGDTGKIPSFTVLLHGSLKVENMVAICQVGSEWYGMLYSWADPHKKKSNLMLSIFEPGVKSLPWLGKFTHLAPHQIFTASPYGEDDNKTPFPVKITEKRSYSLNHVGWIKPAGLQADIQKVLRHARKLPEKMPHFYKELNRVRKAALSYGFTELLDALSAMLDRECRLLPGSAHPDAALQLSHAANALRTEMARDITQTITPMSTKYSSIINEAR